MTHLSDGELKSLLDYPVVRREDLDGIKLYLGDIGWALARPSGTERMLRLYAETSDARVTQRILDQLSTFVQSL